MYSRKRKSSSTSFRDNNLTVWYSTNQQWSIWNLARSSSTVLLSLHLLFPKGCKLPEQSTLKIVTESFGVILMIPLWNTSREANTENAYHDRLTLKNIHNVSDIVHPNLVSGCNAINFCYCISFWDFSKDMSCSSEIKDVGRKKTWKLSRQWRRRC